MSLCPHGFRFTPGNPWATHGVKKSMIIHDKEINQKASGSACRYMTTICVCFFFLPVARGGIGDRLKSCSHQGANQNVKQTNSTSARIRAEERSKKTFSVLLMDAEDAVSPPVPRIIVAPLDEREAGGSAIWWHQVRETLHHWHLTEQHEPIATPKRLVNKRSDGLRYGSIVLAPQ